MKTVLAIMFVSFVLSAGEGTSVKPVILLTGFEPFGGSSFNTSWDVVSQFEGQEIAGHVIKTKQLKVVYDQIHGPLSETVEQLKPVAVISFGEGSPRVEIERVARNGYLASKPHDNDNKAPPREKIIPGGVDEIRSGLPVDILVANLNAAGIKASASTDAGGYLCNECFYRLMAIPNGPALRGFVHLPVVPASETVRRKQLVEAVRIIVKTIATAKRAGN